MKLVLILLACATSGQPSPSLTTSETPDAADNTHNVQDTDCMKACLRNNMARAVAADVIEADCTKSCDTNKSTMNQLEPSL